MLNVQLDVPKEKMSLSKHEWLGIIIIIIYNL